MRRPVVNDAVRVARPPELIGAYEVIGAERRAVNFLAHHAVAVVGGIWFASQFPGNAATQAISFGHLLAPRG